MIAIVVCASSLWLIYRSITSESLASSWNSSEIKLQSEGAIETSSSSSSSSAKRSFSRGIDIANACSTPMSLGIAGSTSTTRHASRASRSSRNLCERSTSDFAASNSPATASGVCTSTCKNRASCVALTLHDTDRPSGLKTSARARQGRVAPFKPPPHKFKSARSFVNTNVGRSLRKNGSICSRFSESALARAGDRLRLRLWPAASRGESSLEALLELSLSVRGERARAMRGGGWKWLDIDCLLTEVTARAPCSGAVR